MQEKRAYHRFKVHVPMRYVLPPRRQEVVGTTLDLSGTGVGFETREELKVRQELLMYLDLDNQKPVEMHVKVVRVKPDPAQAGSYRVGVRIADKMKFDERKYVKFYAGLL